VGADGGARALRLHRGGGWPPAPGAEGPARCLCVPQVRREGGRAAGGPVHRVVRAGSRGAAEWLRHLRELVPPRGLHHGVPAAAPRHQPDVHGGPRSHDLRRRHQRGAPGRVPDRAALRACLRQQGAADPARGPAAAVEHATAGGGDRPQGAGLVRAPGHAADRAEGLPARADQRGGELARHRHPPTRAALLRRRGHDDARVPLPAAPRPRQVDDREHRPLAHPHRAGMRVRRLLPLLARVHGALPRAALGRAPQLPLGPFRGAGHCPLGMARTFNWMSRRDQMGAGPGD